MKLSPYLMFDGQCREAFGFYEQCLGGTIVYMGTYAEAPSDQQAAPEMRDRIMHATLLFDDNAIMASDGPVGQPPPSASNYLAVGVETPEKAEALFAALSEGAQITMPLGETFWAHRFGMLTDRFGVPWMVSADKAMNGSGA